MTKAVLGIIGGSGLYDLPGLENVREERIESPWGEPSAALRIGGRSCPSALIIASAWEPLTRLDVRS